jgi:hypothetical protein
MPKTRICKHCRWTSVTWVSQQDKIDLVMERYGLSYLKAVKWTPVCDTCMSELTKELDEGFARADKIALKIFPKWVGKPKQ